MSDDRISATRRIAAPAAALFAIVTDPARQVEIDGSHMLVSAPGSKRMEAVGDSFAMDMDRDALGDYPLGEYSVINTVTRIEQDRLFEWNVGTADRGPIGHVYGYEFEPVSDSETDVTSYCDWSGISDKMRERVRFPVVPKMALISTLEKLDGVANRGLTRGQKQGDGRVIAVLGAGAMGAALGMHTARTHETMLLATVWDVAAVDAQRNGQPHPALGLHHPRLPLSDPDDWAATLAEAELIVVASSSEGLREMITAAAPLARPDAVWLIATKGWQRDTLEAPSQVMQSVLGDAQRVISLAGPGLAPEIAVGAPTVLVCAGADAGITEQVATTLDGRTLRTVVTDDVAGAETASAFKNVIAVAVGLCEGFSERFPERAAGHAFANARAAVFAQGLRDMTRLAITQGGRAGTVLGPAGAGDLFVTCLGGRNGRFGRRLGSGEPADEALRLAGSTVEGVPNCGAALALAERAGIELPIARVVDAALSGALAGPRGAEEIADLVLSGLTEGLRLVD